MGRVELGFRRLVAYTVGGVALLAFALILRAQFMSQSQPIGAGSLTEDDPFGVTFFAEEGDDGVLAWSPDGRYIAYVSWRGTTSQLFVRDLSTNKVTPIATDAWEAAWSPDGKRLVYRRVAGNESDLYVTDPDGLHHVKVNDVPNAGGAMWLPDGQSLLFIVGGGSGEIHIVTADGSSARTIHIPGVWRFGVTSVSPDGRWAMGYGIGLEGPRTTGLIGIDLQTGDASPLPINDLNASFGIWSPDGQYVAYNTADIESAGGQVIRVARADGSEQRTVSRAEQGYLSGHAWSPDSRFVAYLVNRGVNISEIYVAWADGSRSVPLLPRSIAGPFAWSPDGSQLAISVRHGGQFDIAIVRTDETSLLARQAALEAMPETGDIFTIRRLTSDPDGEYRPAVSPDGRLVVFAGRPDDGYNHDLYLLDLGTGEKKRLTDDLTEDRTPAWSPDGTRIVYQHHAQPGERLEWIVMNVDGSGQSVVASSAAWNNFDEPAAWSPSGDRLAFTDGVSIVVVSLADGREVIRFTPPSDGWYAEPIWLPDGQRLAFAGRGQLAIGNVETGQVDLIATTEVTVRSPMWSDALGRLAYYEESRWGDMRLHSVYPDGSDSLTLTRFDSVTWPRPAWSPDGRFIAYLADNSLCVSIAWTDQYADQPPLFVLPQPIMSADVPFGSIDLRSLAWLPDSSGFVFVGSRDGQPDLYLAALNEAALQAYLGNTPPVTPTPFPVPTSTPIPSPFPTPTPFRDTDFYWLTRLTTDPTGNYRPAVSPDGRRVAFAADRDGNWDIYLLDRATGVETRLTDDPLNDMSPSWSPDGTRIAYQHNIPDPNGPALVERIVMNTDGSGKTVVSSGAVWIGNEAPAWPPSSDRIGFSDGKDVVVVSVADRREVARFSPPEAQAYHNPVWLDDEQVVFTGDGKLIIGNTASGAVAPVDGAPGFASLPMTSLGNPRIGYFALPGPDIRLMTVFPNGAEPYTLAQFSAGLIQHAAWSPNGQFVAYYADESIHVAIAWSEQYRDNAPLFVIPTASGLTDLVGVSWLPDSWGFVFVGAMDGQPDLYLAALNEPAIQTYVAYYPKYAPTQILPGTPTPPPIPTQAFPPTATPWATPTPYGEWLTPTPPSPYWLSLPIEVAGGAQLVASGQHIWVTDQVGQGLHSADGGATWSAITLPTGIRWIAAAPDIEYQLEHGLFAAATDGLHRSIDAGATWQAILTSPGSEFTSVDVSMDGTIFVSEQGACTVHRSTDGGSTWMAFQVSPDSCALARVIVWPLSHDGRRLYALGTDHGLWRSNDRGATWTMISPGRHVDLAFDPVRANQLYTVDGNSVSWFWEEHNLWRDPVPLAGANVIALASYQGPYVGTSDGRVYESLDGGQTWYEVSTFSGDPIRDIAAIDSVIYILTERGLLIGGYREGAPIPATPMPASNP